MPENMLATDNFIRFVASGQMFLLMFTADESDWLRPPRALDARRRLKGNFYRDRLSFLAVLVAAEKALADGAAE